MGYLKNETAIGKVNSDGTASSQAISAFDDVKLPGGVDSRSLTNGQLFNALANAGVEGISAYQARSQLLEALAKHVDALKTAAADKAVARWLERNARPAITGYYSTLDPKVQQQQHTATDPHLDALPLPSGQPVKQLTSSELTALLIDVGVPGVSAAQGRI
jgi:hypothetical protein